MIKTIYNKNTGQIVAVRGGNSIELSVPENYATVEGRYNAATQYIDATGQAQDLPPKPQDDQSYRLNWTTKVWELVVPPVTADSVRDQRNAFLQEIDSVSATRYASLTTEQQTELQQYRQALLAVPQQTGFPGTVTWPAKPTWL